jgi:hypothetical protein
MDDILDILNGFDKRKEILCLWYEVTYLRLIMGKIITKEIAKNMNFEEIKSEARAELSKKFPFVKFEESNASENELEDSLNIDPNHQESSPDSLDPLNES